MTLDNYSSDLVILSPLVTVFVYRCLFNKLFDSFWGSFFLIPNLNDIGILTSGNFVDPVLPLPPDPYGVGLRID